MPSKRKVITSHDAFGYFAAHYQGNLHVLRDDPSTWQPSFGEALEAYPYVVPDVRALAWPQLLAKLALWKHLQIV